VWIEAGVAISPALALMRRAASRHRRSAQSMSFAYPSVFPKGINDDSCRRYCRKRRAQCFGNAR